MCFESFYLFLQKRKPGVRGCRYRCNLWKLPCLEAALLCSALICSARKLLSADPARLASSCRQVRATAHHIAHNYPTPQPQPLATCSNYFFPRFFVVCGCCGSCRPIHRMPQSRWDAKDLVSLIPGARWQRGHR